METKSTQLAVEVRATDRNFRHFAKAAVVLVVLFVIGSLSYIAWHSNQTTSELQRVITTQGTEISQIKSNQTQNHSDNQSQLTAIKGLLQQQDAYNKCLVSLFTHATFVPTSALETCAPLSSDISDSSGLAPQSSSTPNTTQIPAQASQNSPGSTSTAPTPPSQPTIPKQNVVQRLLKDIGL